MNKKGQTDILGVLGGVAVGVVVLTICLVVTFLMMSQAQSTTISTGATEAWTGADTSDYTLTTGGVMPSTFSVLYPAAKVTKGATAGVQDSNEGLYVSSDNTYSASDVIITGSTLQALTAGAVSGANGVWSGDTAEGVWDDKGTLANFVDAGDSHLTTETLYAADGATTTEIYLTDLTAIAVGDVLTVETGAVDTDVTVGVVTYATKKLVIVAADFSSNKASLLTTAKLKTNVATTSTSDGDADLASAGTKTISVDSLTGLAVGDVLTFTCTAGTANGTVLSIPSPITLSVNITASDCSDQTSVNVSVKTPAKADGATLAGVLTIPIQALTNAKVSILLGGTANVWNTYEGAYVSSDNTLSAGDQIVKGETLEALTGGYTLNALHYTTTEAGGFVTKVKLSVAGDAIYDGEDMTLQFSESTTADQGVTTLRSAVATIPGWTTLIILTVIGGLLIGLVSYFRSKN